MDKTRTLRREGCATHRQNQKQKQSQKQNQNRNQTEFPSPKESRDQSFPWELRLRQQLLRAERDDAVRRELAVGTGPLDRR